MTPTPTNKRRMQPTPPGVQKVQFEGTTHVFPNDFSQAEISKALAMAHPTVADLGRRVKAKYAGSYDDLPDDELGRRVKAKFPGSYDDFADHPTAQPNDWTTVDPGDWKTVSGLPPATLPADFFSKQQMTPPDTLPADFQFKNPAAQNAARRTAGAGSTGGRPPDDWADAASAWKPVDDPWKPVDEGARPKDQDPGFWSTIGDALKNGPTRFMDFITGHPIQQLSERGKAMGDAAKEAWKRGDHSTAIGLGLASMIPGAGDEAVAAGNEFGSGHTGAGAAHTALALAPFFGKYVPGAVDAAVDGAGMVAETARGAARGTAQTVARVATSPLTRETIGSIPGAGPLANAALRKVALASKLVKAVTEGDTPAPAATVKGITYPNGDYPGSGKPAAAVTGGKPAPVVPDDFSPPRTGGSPLTPQVETPVPTYGQPQQRTPPPYAPPMRAPQPAAVPYPPPRQPGPLPPNVDPPPPPTYGQPIPRMPPPDVPPAAPPVPPVAPPVAEGPVIEPNPPGAAVPNETPPRMPYFTTAKRPPTMGEMSDLNRAVHGVAAGKGMGHSALSDSMGLKYGVKSMKDLTADQLRETFKDLSGEDYAPGGSQQVTPGAAPKGGADSFAAILAKSILGEQ
jgi:hypothetical protein